MCFIILAGQDKGRPLRARGSTAIVSRPSSGNDAGKLPTLARQLVVHLADSDVLELMALEDRWRSQSARELNTRTFRVYAQIRNALPETHTVPAYVLDNERAEYLEKTHEVQQYLEGNSALQRP
jgi:hypothetical protein